MAGHDDEAALRKALRQRPNDPTLLANLGRLLRARGKAQEALACYRRAAAHPKAPAGVFFNLGNALLAGNAVAEAEDQFLQALKRDSGLAAAAIQAGRCAVRLGKSEAARAHFAAALRIEPGNYSAWLETGHLCRNLGDGAAMVHAFERAAHVASDRFEAHLALARALEEAGHLAEAAGAYHRALAAAGEGQPAARQVHRRMAGYRLERGDLARALEALRQALYAASQEQPAPDSEILAELNADLCEILIRLGLGDAARPAFERACSSSSEALLLRLAQRLTDQGIWEDALPPLRRNVALRPHSASARHVLATCLIKSCRFAEGLAELERAAALPDAPDATHLHAYAAAMTGEVDRAVALYRGLGEQQGPDGEYRSSAAMASLYSDSLTPQGVADLHRSLFAPLYEGARSRESFGNDRDPERRLRVGFVTPDLHHHHPVCIFMQPILARLGATTLDVTVYATGRSRDAQTEIAKRRVRHWVEAADLPNGVLGERIERDRIDLLIDLSGHSTGQRMALFAKRAAPVQITFLGYPGSTGVPNMDWILGDPVVTPESADALCSERVARLPHTVFCYAPETDTPFPSFESSATRPLTFGSFNTLIKLTPRTVRLWARVLATVPGSRLLLKTQSFTDASAVQLVRQRFAAQGIAAERLTLRGPSDLDAMMAQYGEIDIALDPLPYNGGTTTHQALWMGAPVICGLGQHFVSRMSASFSHAAGLDDFIARDDDEYVEIARRMTADRAALAALKSGMRERLRAAPAWDADRYVADFEATLRGCWRDWCSSAD